MTEKIVLVTTTQPALNPRLIKEADALSSAGYKVTVLYSYWNKWGAQLSKQLLANKKWTAICIGGDPEGSPILYWASKVLFKIGKLFAKQSTSIFWTDIAISRTGWFLKREAQKYKADLYIGHNPGALPAVVAGAKANNKLCGFDAEDFHRNERSDDKYDLDVVLKTRLEDTYFPQLDYLTTSSPQIANVYKELYAGISPTVLLNVFPVCNNVVETKAVNKSGTIKLFWFSQTIGAKRGLQDVVGAIKLLDKQQFELHILGSQLHCDPYFIKDLLNSGINIKMYDPIPPDELVAFANNFDIGLALEPAFNTNNNIALSNKIFTYMQAGLAIIASDTAAQQYLLDTNPGIGHVYPKGNINALAILLSSYYNNRYQLAQHQSQALKIARETYNWETESKKFLTVVKQVLSATD